MPRLSIPIDQFFDRNGNPLDGGFLYTRETDGTTSKKTYPTQADLAADTNAHTNPIVFDDEGRAPQIWGSGNYWLNIEDKNSVQIPEWPKSPVEVSDVINTPDLFYGLTLSNGADSDHDIDIAIGGAMDSTGAVRMDLTTAFTKQIDATWVAGTDVGGLASGASLANSTWYHVFLVLVGGTADVMFDTSVTCANGVANNAVTSYQYINSVLTNSSSNIVAFNNVSDYMWWDVPRNNENQSNPGSSAVSVSLDAPLGIKTLADISISADNGSTGMGFILALGGDQTATTPTSTIHDIDSDTSDSQSMNKSLLTNTSSQIKYICSTGTDGIINIISNGWKVLR